METLITQLQALVISLTALVSSMQTTPLELPLGAVAPQTIEQKISGKSYTEAGRIKGEEISNLGSIPKTKRGNYSIEVVSVSPIKDGVEVLIKAWDESGQIAFGDGTVEIERIKIHNPPILVPDPNGAISSSVYHEETGKTITRKYREDAKEALLQDLEHTLKVKKQKYNSAKLVKGKVGNTTETYYPVAGANSPVDGRNVNDDTTWAGSHDAASSSFASATDTGDYCGDRTFNAASWNISRCPFLFDTNGAGTPTTATFSLNSASSIAAKSDSDNASVVVVQSTLAATNAVAAADYNDYGTTSFGSVDITAWDDTDGNYNDIALNASGISNINLSGISYFGFRSSTDIDNTTPTVGGGNRVFIWFADQTGTTQDPKLSLEVAGANNSGAGMMMSQTF